MPDIDLSSSIKEIQNLRPLRVYGRIRQVIGNIVEASGLRDSIGTLCHIKKENYPDIPAEIVGFRDDVALLMPLGEMEGIKPQSLIQSTGSTLKVKVSDELLGRVVDGMGNPSDGKGELSSFTEVPLSSVPPPPLSRPRIRDNLGFGVRAIDSCLTIGKGQRIGIFSGSGVGKSTLMGMIARYTSADVNVIGLIGERGREVLEFIEDSLGEEGLKRSVVVAATSDQPALIRLKGALVATSIAEFFRDQGKDVMLMMDSLTRFAQAQREIGLSVGEPPTTRGYTPSIFALLPKLLERSGNSGKGSITGIYTVLIEADDMNEPIADAARAILDGHIVLSREIASRGHYPPIDVLGSVSRLMIEVVDEETFEYANKVREILSTYREAEDLINIGAYIKGSNPRIDFAIKMIERTNIFLRQGIKERTDFADNISSLKKLFTE